LNSQTLRIIRHGPVLGVLALLMVACGNHAPDARFNTPAPQSAAPATTAPATTAPPAEGTGPEPPAPPGGGPPAITVASLPIGGTADNPGSVHQCAPANWLGGEIPDGISVLVTAVRIEPSGVFTQSRSGCPGPLCRPSFAFTSHQTTCNVPVTATGSATTSANLYLAGTVRCPAGKYTSCKDFATATKSGLIPLEGPEPAQRTGPSRSAATG
jgi:hypothetical protein